MNRRTLIASVGGAAALLVRPAASWAQKPTVGLLVTTTASSSARWTAGFARRLHELGWIEGRTVAIEYRWAEGRGERFAEFAAEFARLDVDVIVTSGAAVSVVRKAAPGIPIAFAMANDPLGSGMVANLARPGGNVTGLSLQAPDLAGKRLEYLREILPGVRRLAILANVGYPSAALEMAEVESTAGAVGIAVTKLEIRDGAELAAKLATAAGTVDALYVCADPLTNTHRVRINTLAVDSRLPTVWNFSEYVAAGGLISYGPNITDMFRRTAEIVDKILRGTKPGDIPVEQPTKFELAINLKTAKSLGLDIPAMLLATADEVIE